jgi:hypothetical protein
MTEKDRLQDEACNRGEPCLGLQNSMLLLETGKLNNFLHVGLM